MPARSELICEPAECYADCDDRMCPYMHRDAWSIRRYPDLGYFRTQVEALQAMVVQDCKKRKQEPA
jgi:hypothetical protein